ncbi:uncharacterized protein LOC133185211 [Saccostrea echinata]|uniref:uncharacterized protein LOC133185211 n=1 Tax=Saccostrea echinata TaxID=191078 RepID=UPI002A8019AB|nr:uncharacterized protein LOC133185211 [Saccostrea echinata]
MLGKTVLVTIFLASISVTFASTVDRISDSDEIYRRFDNLERRIQTLESENKLLRGELEKQNVSLGTLKSDLATQYGNLDLSQRTLKQDIKNQYILLLKTQNEVKTNYTELRFKIDTDVREIRDSLAVTNETLQTVTDFQGKKLIQLEGTLESLKNDVRNVNSRTGETPPSFYALLTSTVPIRGSNQTIIYDKTGTNNGNAYNTSTGIFTVPETGTYVFTWTAFSYVEEYVRLEIVVAGTIYGGTLSDTQETGDADTETAIVVANAKVGDEVFIRTQSRGPGDGRLYVEFECTSTFSGWKIS